MKYTFHKDFMVSVRALYQFGGKFQTAAEKVQMVVGRTNLQEEDIFKGLSLTNYGESRIDHCVKFDLTGFARLIMIQDNGICAFCFAGKHPDCDKWLDRNQGLRLTVDGDNVLARVFTSNDISNVKSRIVSQTDLSTGKLFEKLPKRYYNRMAEGIDPTILKLFQELESIVSEEEILELAYQIDERNQREVFFDVFCLLRNGDVIEAKKRIDLFTNDRLLIAEVEEERVQSVVEGDEFSDAEVFTELFEHFIKTADYRDWMLFMGNEQRKVVDRDFSGPAKLTGVSGSGKTCVVINRSIRLAKKYEGKNILILTLSRALSKLIENLVDYACPPGVRSFIIVKSFWELCQEQLRDFEPNDFAKLYTDVTWKHGEHITEIWNEFYDIWKQRECNNLDAHECLFDVHRALLSRGVFPKQYISQEFDWIRTAFPPSERDGYLDIERRGRSVPLTRDLRKLILKGLECWENKMRSIGVIDYLGLAVTLHKHIEKIEPRFKCILVDEAQDFGTIELQIVRRLVPEDENDVFLTGDVAQRVYTKHHKVKSAGIDYSGRTTSITRNYRNSREILGAAYNVLKQNSSLDAFTDEDFEILEPEFANYSTPKPLALRADSLDDEFARSFNYLRKKYPEQDKKKACIAIAGYSMIELKPLGEKLGLPILDGTKGLAQGTIFLSDLDQTKGFEFDTICILNCNKMAIPNPALPEAEWYRELSKFYVAMTRAKQELIISYSSNLTEFVRSSRDYFVFALWSEHEESDVVEQAGMDLRFDSISDTNVLDLAGTEFLYTKRALGCSLSLQQKLVEKIEGKDVYANGKRIGWRSLRALFMERTGRLQAESALQFGYAEYGELQEKLKDVLVTHSASSA